MKHMTGQASQRILSAAEQTFVGLAHECLLVPGRKTGRIAWVAPRDPAGAGIVGH